jgi:peptide/nickel transport system substrate-binding protein
VEGKATRSGRIAAGRLWQITALALVLALTMAAGCASQTAPASPTEPATGATTPAPAAATTAPEPTKAPPPPLKVGTTRQVKTANLISDYWYGVIAGLTSHDMLVRIDPAMEIKPWLAEEWTASDQGKVWRFKLTKDAKWHDGKPVTADDIVFTFEYRAEKDPQSGWLKGVLESVAIEGDDVVVRLNKPYSTFLVELAVFRILPQHIWETVDDPLTFSEDAAAIGCGPFALEKMDESAGVITFRAVADHFKGRPTVDKLEFHLYRNVDSMVMALSKGQIDVTWDYSASIPYTSVPALEQASGVEFAMAVDMGIPVALGFNLDRYPTSERWFREAVSYAIDYEQIAELIMAGYGRAPTLAFAPPSMRDHDVGAAPLQYDVKKAVAALDAAGLKDVNGDGLRETPQGEKISLTLLSRTDSAAITRSAELLQGYLKAIGIDATIKALDTATWVALKDGMEYDLVLFRTTPWGMLMHAGHGSGYFDSRRTGAGVLHNLDDPDFLALTDKTLSTTDEAASRDLAVQLQRAYAEHLPGIALTWAENVYPYRDSWEGWQIDVIYGGPVNIYSLFTVTPTGR